MFSSLEDKNYQFLMTLVISLLPKSRHIKYPFSLANCRHIPTISFPKAIKNYPIIQFSFTIESVIRLGGFLSPT